MPTVYLGLGSNLGDRQQNIAQAICELEKAGLQIIKLSTLIETDPVGGPAQGKFLNAVLKAKTLFAPHDLLNHIHAIEKTLGRVRTVKNGPRTIDIDILLYDRLRIESPELSIPHPRMKERDFVLTPLREIEPKFENLFSR